MESLRECIVVTTISSYCYSMSFLLGLDVGSKRVGVAIADNNLRIATPIDTFNRARGEAEREILRIITERQITTIIIGLPYGANEGTTSQFESITRFTERLKKRTTAKVVYVDEYCSSSEAEEKLAETGRRLATRRKHLVDALAASIILDSYLKGVAATDA